MNESEEMHPSPLLEYVSKNLGIDGVKLTETTESLVFEVDEIPKGDYIMLPSIRNRTDLQKFSDLLAGKEIIVKIGTVKGNYSFFGKLTL